jgi:DNA-binding NarL/FixJ family response regulator
LTICGPEGLPAFGIIPGTMMATSPPLHLLIVDDHAMVRTGLAQLLHGLHPGCRVSEAGDLAQAGAVLDAPPEPSLLLLDVHLPGEPPMGPLRALRRSHPLLPVLMMSGDTDPVLAARALDEGAAGWLPKSADAAELGQALAVVQAGGCWVPPHLRGLPPVPPEQLTERQQEVLAELVRGRSNKEIARTLGMAEPTVKGHLVSIFRVLRVRNRAEAVLAGQAHLRASGRL